MTEPSRMQESGIPTYYQTLDALRTNVMEATDAVHLANVRLGELLLDNLDHALKPGTCLASNICPVCMQLVVIQTKNLVMDDALARFNEHIARKPK